MLTAFRAQRMVALVLLLLAPGVSGSAVQWLHSCPTQADPAEHQHHESGRSDSGQQLCDCIGSCTAAGVVTLATPLTIRVAVEQPDTRIAAPAGTSFVSSSSSSHLLPPATAPPLA